MEKLVIYKNDSAQVIGICADDLYSVSKGAVIHEGLPNIHVALLLARKEAETLGYALKEGEAS